MAIHVKRGHLRDHRTIAFTLIELLVVISIIALLIALLLPALGRAKETARIALCASGEHQMAVAFHSYGADNGGYLPPGSGYIPYGSVPNIGVWGSKDFFDVLSTGYVDVKEAWYCPDGPIFPETDDAWPWKYGPTYSGCCFDTDGNPATEGMAYFSYAYMTNLWQPGDLNRLPMYRDTPGHLDDPTDWILILDYTLRGTESSSLSWAPSGEYVRTNHPGQDGNTGIAVKPAGTNKCLLDGSVRWVRESEAVDGYPSCGGSPGIHVDCVLIK